MVYRIEFSDSALQELDEYISYYEELVQGLGLRFRAAVDKQVVMLESLPYMQLRYETIRCVPVPGFPYMLHYSVFDDRALVRIHAVIHTSRNPRTNWNNTSWIVSEKVPLYGMHAYDLEYYYAA